MDIDTSYLKRGTNTLEKAYSLFQKADKEEIDYDMYLSDSIKEFEIIIEQSGKLLKKVLKPYFHSSKAVDSLVFKNTFRNAALHTIIDTDTCERWLVYRDNHNSTAHDYGLGFAEDTLLLLPQFLIDAKALAAAIDQSNA